MRYHSIPSTLSPCAITHRISYDRLEPMLQFLLEPIALQDINDSQVEHDSVTMDTTLNVPFPVGREKWSQKQQQLF